MLLWIHSVGAAVAPDSTVSQLRAVARSQGLIWMPLQVRLTLVALDSKPTKLNISLSPPTDDCSNVRCVTWQTDKQTPCMHVTCQTDKRRPVCTLRGNQINKRPVCTLRGKQINKRPVRTPRPSVLPNLTNVSNFYGISVGVLYKTLLVTHQFLNAYIHIAQLV